MYDSLGRLGGEEFLILFPGAQEAEGMAICNRIRDAIAKKTVDIEGAKINVTVSQGIVGSDGEMEIDPLIDMADKAMYVAKKNGRNRVERFDTESYKDS